MRAPDGKAALDLAIAAAATRHVIRADEGCKGRRIGVLTGAALAIGGVAGRIVAEKTPHDHADTRAPQAWARGSFKERNRRDAMRLRQFTKQRR